MVQFFCISVELLTGQGPGEGGGGVGPVPRQGGSEERSFIGLAGSH